MWNGRSEKEMKIVNSIIDVVLCPPLVLNKICLVLALILSYVFLQHTHKPNEIYFQCNRGFIDFVILFISYADLNPIIEGKSIKSRSKQFQNRVDNMKISKIYFQWIEMSNVITSSVFFIKIVHKRILNYF